MGTDQPRRYHLGEGIFTTKVNFPGPRRCLTCGTTVSIGERIDTEHPSGHHETYCFTCYPGALGEGGETGA